MHIVTVLLNPAIDRVIDTPGLILGQHLKGRLRVRYPAGKALNLSRSLAILGHPSIATGFVGEGEIGFYEEYIHLHHGNLINCRYVSVEGGTRENITLIDTKAQRETHIRDVGFTVTQEDVDRLRKLLAELVTKESLVCFCGSLPPGIDDDTFLNLVDLCVTAEARVAIDSSGPHMKKISNKSIWLVKPNVAELEEITSRMLESASSLYEAAQHLNEQIELVLVSAGERGAYLVTRGGAWRGYLRLPKESIVNTVGCGDALVAGFLAGAVSGLSFAEALRRGVAAAGASALSEAAAGFKDSDFRRLLHEAAILPWNPSRQYDHEMPLEKFRRPLGD